MQSVKIPERSTVNGLRIAGWQIADLDNYGEVEPAFYCDNDITHQEREHLCEAIPVYNINCDGSEVCDVCLERLTDDIVINDEDEEVGPHYHIVEFINGCLNDYDSGPYEDLADAQSDLKDMVENHNENALWFNENGLHEDPYVEEGEDLYTRNIYILKIEECTQDCTNHPEWQYL